jgi:hypothetical protein
VALSILLGGAPQLARAQDRDTVATAADTLTQPPDTVVGSPADTAARDTAAPRDPAAFQSPIRPEVHGYAVDADAVARWRMQQLAGAPTHGFLLRSASSMLEATRPTAGVSLLTPAALMVVNSAMPSAGNEGPLWAGQGASTLITAGVRLAFGPLRAVLAPQLVYAENRDWDVRDTTLWWSPTPPPGREGRAYASSWYQGRFSIDLPLRFGGESLARVDPGQSSLYLRTGPLEFGTATENHWWGPGIRNALVLSNAAPGFLHLFLRSAAPWRTAAGALEWRWISGALQESDYFDDDPDNDTRSLAALAVVLQPSFANGLSLGATRAIVGRASGPGAALTRWLHVFTSTGRAEPAVAWYDTTSTGEREQILSLFARYVMPAVGAEVYGEWGRTALASPRDILIAPNHTQGYTLGLQWTRPYEGRDSRLQIQAEVTTVEESATFRDRPVPTWYASRRVPQGYTHRGQMLGAAIGPGSSGQWLALDYFTPRGSFGGYTGRTRWNEDIRSSFDWPDYMRYCNHDVSMYGGLRGSIVRGWGMLGADLRYERRINAFFQAASCFPPGRRNINNLTFRLSVAPRL